ncbi:MAG: Wzz/FepE/Etk N-terminal domain-containing protein [bacterium]|nr:Wzz/FepE/Etk N-terminal domain-containing protein [bacterium]
MSLIDYFRILIRRGWILILLALLAGGSAYLFSRGQTPIYAATQTVLIQPSRADFGLAEASLRLLEPLAVYLRSNERAQEIVDDLRLDMSAGEVLGNTNFAPDQFRLSIRIEVESTDPAVAQQIARAWGQQLVDYRNERNQLSRREDRVEALLTDQPTIGQVAPRPTLVAAAGAILGLLLGGVIVFVLEYLESGIVRRREDLERSLEIPVLASVPPYTVRGAEGAAESARPSRASSGQAAQQTR